MKFGGGEGIADLKSAAGRRFFDYAGVRGFARIFSLPGGGARRLAALAVAEVCGCLPLGEVRSYPRCRGAIYSARLWNAVYIRRFGGFRADRGDRGRTGWRIGRYI